MTAKLMPPPGDSSSAPAYRNLQPCPFDVPPSTRQAPFTAIYLGATPPVPHARVARTHGSLAPSTCPGVLQTAPARRPASHLARPRACPRPCSHALGISCSQPARSATEPAPSRSAAARPRGGPHMACTAHTSPHHFTRRVRRTHIVRTRRTACPSSIAAGRQSVSARPGRTR